MRYTVILSLLTLLMSLNVNAGCEALIMKGNHTAIIKQEAIDGALEDAKELCYPGKALADKLLCKKTLLKTAKKEPAFVCTQEVVCNLCGEALLRKLEAKQDSDEPN